MDSNKIQQSLPVCTQMIKKLLCMDSASFFCASEQRWFGVVLCYLSRPSQSPHVAFQTVSASFCIFLNVSDIFWPCQDTSMMGVQ